MFFKGFRRTSLNLFKPLKISGNSFGLVCDDSTSGNAVYVRWWQLPHLAKISGNWKLAGAEGN